MLVVHDHVKAMDIPIEKLRFDPDPWALNGPSFCPCIRCRIQRAIAEQCGIPPEAVAMKMAPVTGGFPLLDVEPKPVQPVPKAPVVHVAAFDTRRDGTPHIPRDQPPARKRSPAWKIAFVHAVAAAWVGLLVFERLAMSLLLRRPRLKIIRKED